LAQGFYWSKPRPADEIELVLLEGKNLGPMVALEQDAPSAPDPANLVAVDAAAVEVAAEEIDEVSSPVRAAS
jgi:hypothetical protein